MTRHAPVHVSNLIGAEVFEAAFNGHSLIRMSAGDQSYCLGVEGEFALHVGDAIERGQGENLVSLPLLARLVGRKAKAFEVRRDGSAVLQLEDGARLVAKPGGEYENWNFSGPEGLYLVGGTEGQFHSWQ